MVTWVASRECHKVVEISGDFANAAKASRRAAFSLEGTGQPISPKNEATGSQDWFSQSAILTLSLYGKKRRR